MFHFSFLAWALWRRQIQHLAASVKLEELSVTHLCPLGCLWNVQQDTESQNFLKDAAAKRSKMWAFPIPSEEYWQVVFF